MSYADPSQLPPPGSPPARPTTVTASTWLLWLTAALYVISTVATLMNIGTFTDVYEEAYAGTEVEGQEAGTIVGIWVGGVVSLLFAVGFVLLGLFNNRGRNPSRITTWVVGGLALCCTGTLLALSGLLSGMDVEGGPDPAEVDRMLSDALPGWYDPVYWTTSIGSIVALIVALVLLALPASNEFFRKRPEEVFEPPPNYPPPAPPPPAGS